MMTQKRTIAAYAIYLFAITVFFLYTGFPEATIRKFVTQAAASKLPNTIVVAFGQVSPAIPPGIVFKDIRLSHKKAGLLQLERLVLRPDYLSFATGSPALRFKGDLHGGTANGTIRGLGKGPKEVMIRIEAVDLAQLGAIKAAAPERAVTGKMSGQCHISTDSGGAARVALETVVTDATVALLLPIGSIGSIPFDRIDIKATVTGMAVAITSCVWKSPLLTGSLSGAIDVREPAGDSTITLNGNVLPQQALMRELGEPLASRLFPGNRRRQNGFQIALTGTVEKPGFNIK